MKKIAALLIALLLGFTFPIASSEQGPVEIASREDLQRIADDPGGRYVLTADIDMGDEPWTPIPFSGTLDGAGHTIGNLTVTAPGSETETTFDGNRKEYTTCFAGLFSTAKGAHIQNLRLLNAKLTIESDRHCFLGAIAGYAYDTEILDCTVVMRGSLTTTAINVGVGGVVGFSERSTYERLSVEAELLFIDVNQEDLCEEFLGGVYACGYSTIRDCSVYTRGYADIYGYAHNGGVVGMFKLPRDFRKHQYLSGTSVDAEITFFEITPSRRAYCKALIGEDNAKDCYLSRNKELHFARKESRTATPSRPETCSNPVYTETVTQPTCESWGYTTFTCETCGYTFCDRYTLPSHDYRTEETPATCTQAGRRTYTCTLCGDTRTEPIPPLGHTPGEWILVKAPGVGEDGLEELRCAVCGETLETRVIPGEMPSVAGVVLGETTLNLKTGETAALSVTFEPSDDEVKTVRFESDASGIASVDESGRVTARSAGVATIKVTGADGVSVYCFVTVIDETEPIEWIETQPEESAAPTEAPNPSSSWLRCG